MGIIRLIAGVIVLITALGGYMSWKYSTTSTCEAAQKAITAEMPTILDDLAATDTRFRALKVGGALLGGLDSFISGAATQLAADEVKNSSAIECAVMVGRREVDPSGFRESVAERMSDRLAERLPF